MVFEGTSTCPAGGGPRSRGRASAAEFQGNSGWQLISCQTTSWSLKIPQTDSNAAFFCLWWLKRCWSWVGVRGCGRGPHPRMAEAFCPSMMAQPDTSWVWRSTIETEAGWKGTWHLHWSYASFPDLIPEFAIKIKGFQLRMQSSGG